MHLDLNGYPVVLADTAGLRDEAGAIEAEGIRRALARAEQADLRLAVFDGTRYPDIDLPTGTLVDDRALVVVNKADEAKLTEGLHILDRPAYILSAKTGDGLDALLTALGDAVSEKFNAGSETPALTRARHRVALEECRASLDRALSEDETELAAENLRHGMAALGRITGRVDVEQILDVVFSDFCIGK